LGLALGDVVKLQDPVLLGFEVAIGGLFPGLDHLKRHALLTEQNPQALMADVFDHPLGDQELGEFGQTPRRERQTMISRPRQRHLADLATLGQRERRRPATAIAGIQRIEPIGIEVVDHRSDPVLRRKRHPGDPGHVHPLGR